MATNEVYDPGTKLSVVATDPASPASGDPVIVGQFGGVAQTKMRADGTTSITTKGVFTLTVKAIDAGGNSPVAPGDVLYYVTGDTPKLSKKNTGVRFGYAHDALATGTTGAIRVILGW